ncbi:unnamed protein product [Caenorhabditis angaria]|uniref:Uncharacterized protein n=1 Tax=Caenorhabditis angaria TaxID=860376 RepID=A0A9P1MYV9_9PELO|nr:unnamed protein product [Caenorhabditis angaria]
MLSPIDMVGMCEMTGKHFMGKLFGKNGFWENVQPDLKQDYDIFRRKFPIRVQLEYGENWAIQSFSDQVPRFF